MTHGWVDPRAAGRPLEPLGPVGVWKLHFYIRVGRVRRESRRLPGGRCGGEGGERRKGDNVHEGPVASALGLVNTTSSQPSPLPEGPQTPSPGEMAGLHPRAGFTQLQLMAGPTLAVPRHVRVHPGPRQSRARESCVVLLAHGEAEMRERQARAPASQATSPLGPHPLIPKGPFLPGLCGAN